jgi:hypothetical protein
MAGATIWDAIARVIMGEKPADLPVQHRRT